MILKRNLAYSQTERKERLREPEAAHKLGADPAEYQRGTNVIDLQIRKAVEAFSATVTVQLLLADKEGKPIPRGTGTLFEVGDRQLVVTAKHLFDELEPDDLERFCVPEGPRGGIFTVGNCDLHRPKEGHVDIAFLEFKERETIERMRTGWRFLTMENVADASPTGDFVLTGYPEPFTIREGSSIVGGLASVYTQRIAVPADLPFSAAPIIEGLNDLFFAYTETATLGDGTTIPSPVLLGASGGSLWEYCESPREQPLWNPDQAVKVVGVQASYRRDHYIRGIRWTIVEKGLRMIGAIP